MDLPAYLTRNPDGEIHLTGHRIGLFHIVHYYQEGQSAEMLVCQYPTLPLSLVHKVIAFYLENQAEVDTYVTHCQADLEVQRAVHSQRLDVRALRQRLEAQRRADKALSAEQP